MEKQEILEKSRKENQLCDEGILRAQEKGRQWGVVGFLLCVRRYRSITWHWGWTTACR